MKGKKVHKASKNVNNNFQQKDISYIMKKITYFIYPNEETFTKE